MKSSVLKKIIICAVSAVTVAFTAVSASACSIETDHPEVQITYDFNGESYEVKYTLYRNMYPHTVRHFIELAKENFYDNTIIHDYKTTDWFTGGYEYNEEDYTALSGNANQLSEYFELDSHSKEEAYYKLHLTPSVYKNRGYDDKQNETVKEEDALQTVMGEFYNNIHQDIEKGKLTAEYGCLKMFYYEKETTQKIYVTPTKDQIIMADYKKNCATSLFALQTGTSSSYSESNYAVFARLSSTEIFDDLVDAVNEYISSNHGGTASNFYTATDVRVDNLDTFSKESEKDRGISVTFNVPKTPIIIKSVKVTKY